MLIVVPWIWNISITFPGLEITILLELNFNILHKHLSGEGAILQATTLKCCLFLL